MHQLKFNFSFDPSRILCASTAVSLLLGLTTLKDMRLRGDLLEMFKVILVGKVLYG